jgi:hypothetical protein
LSHDNKYLLTQSTEPDWQLQLWLWEKSKVHANLKLNYTANVKVLQVSFNPFEKNLPQVCVVGHNIFRVYRFTEGTLKPLTFQKTDHRVQFPFYYLLVKCILRDSLSDDVTSFTLVEHQSCVD